MQHNWSSLPRNSLQFIRGMALLPHKALNDVGVRHLHAILFRVFVVTLYIGWAIFGCVVHIVFLSVCCQHSWQNANVISVTHPFGELAPPTPIVVVINLITWPHITHVMWMNIIIIIRCRTKSCGRPPRKATSLPFNMPSIMEQMWTGKILKTTWD